MSHLSAQWAFQVQTTAQLVADRVAGEAVQAIAWSGIKYGIWHWSELPRIGNPVIGKAWLYAIAGEWSHPINLSSGSVAVLRSPDAIIAIAHSKKARVIVVQHVAETENGGLKRLQWEQL